MIYDRAVHVRCQWFGIPATEISLHRCLHRYLHTCRDTCLDICLHILMQACLCGPVCCSHFRQSEVAELHFCTCTRARAHTHTHTCFVVYAYAWVDVRIYAHFLMPVAYICPILTEHARMHVALLCLRACTWACAHRLREAKCQHTNWEGLSCADLAVSLLSNIF